MTTTLKKTALKDASHLYKVERRAYHLAPGFRISELQLSPTQTVPWHSTITSAIPFMCWKVACLFLQNRSRRCNSVLVKATRWRRDGHIW